MTRDISPRGGELVVEPARPDEAAALLALRERAAAWLAARGVRQWEPGEVDLAQVHHQVEAGEWHVVRDAGRPVAALRLLERDEDVWGPRPPEAVYVHGLVVDRTHAGADLGGRLLQWAAAQARTRGRRLLRLDCGEENDALRCWYARQGFQVVGRQEGDGTWFSVVLLERSA